MGKLKKQIFAIPLILLLLLNIATLAIAKSDTQMIKNDDKKKSAELNQVQSSVTSNVYVPQSSMPNQGYTGVISNVYMSVGVIDQTGKSEGDDIVDQLSKDGKKVIRELIDKRTQRSRHYQLSDGTYKEIIFSEDINYIDQNGNWQPIKTDLVDESTIEDIPPFASREISRDTIKEFKKNKKNNSESYRGLRVPYDPKINKDYSHGYSVSKGQDKLFFKPIGANSVIGSVYNNSISYRNAWDNVDVSLSLTETGIKEYIIVKNDSVQNIFTFELEGNLSDDLKAGAITVLPAWLVDAEGEHRDVIQKVRKEGNKTYLDLIADYRNLKFPILIDPSTTTSLNCYDCKRIFLDTYNVQASAITSISASSLYIGTNYIFNESCQCYNMYSYTKPVFTNLYATKSEYGRGADNNNVAPGDDGKNVAYLNGFTQNTYYTGNDLITKVGSSTMIYGVAFYSPYEFMTSASVSIFYTDPDSEPPTAPTNLVVTSTTRNSVSLSWTASTDNVGVTGYDIYSNNFPFSGVLEGSVNGSTTTYTVSLTWISNNPDYSFFVKAKDGVGNISTSSNTVVVTLDTESPTRPYVFVNKNTSSSITLTWTASTDNVGVTGYDIYNGETLVGSVNGSTTTYMVTGLAANMLYSFSVIAKDAAGNKSKSNNMFFANGKLTYNYDSQGRLTSISITSTGQVVKSFSYDNNGNLLSQY
ncbi:YD repeat-containing protein [Paenibacillus sp. 1_12]|uniref:fibronectin type III domain-containing protein n=1 Tax=Paenibacillus sp. 1_12 TaxID=1566278 RepID=UPI0008E4CC10|nr:fibronectin type III domain-containing protein [Paenibacillus sp. 1_12]SFM52169.1 YD repeat-containing protein [Paenibacillus sp. 1_12]